MNFLIALPAAIITIIVLLVVGRPETVTEMGNLSFNVIKVIPYLAVLVLALIGMNVFLVLTIGIFAAGIIGLALGDLDIPLFAQSIWNGFTGMNEVFFLSLFCGGMSEMIAHNGGITWLIEKLGRMMKGNKSAQVGVAALVSLADCATANNTVAIIVSGPMSKNMSRIHKVDPRRTASLLDVFSCVLQGMIPWGAQLLTAASLTTIYGVTMNPIDILPYMWYCWILAAVGILSIFIPFADGHLPQGPLELGVRCGGVRRGCQEGFSGAGAAGVRADAHLTCVSLAKKRPGALRRRSFSPLSGPLLKPPGEGDGIRQRLLQQADELLRQRRGPAAADVDPAQVDRGLPQQRDRDYASVRQPLRQQAAAGGERIGGRQHVHRRGPVVHADALCRLFQRDHGVLLEKVRRHALVVLKRHIRISVQLLLRYAGAASQRMPPANIDTGADGGQFVEFQLPGVQQPADNLLRQIRQADDAHVRRWS